MVFITYIWNKNNLQEGYIMPYSFTSKHIIKSNQTGDDETFALLEVYAYA